ncbi:hypothetical protein [Actinotalea sp. Marseille-Q4924]|uniref:hypothetical protein n=1 Tax=Actinotalea sp. Marseille-Q4924 TaxID=2866571 RepID=UPI001CE45962|nr:hypothetical protein [Actinotalea sp. Marseille-Q4924]
MAPGRLGARPLPGLPPLWRAAPGRLLRTAAWFWTLAAATALLVAAVVSIPLFERSVAAGAFDAEISAVDPDDVGRNSPNVRVIIPGVLPERLDEQARELLDDVPVLTTPVVSTFGSAERLSPRVVTSFVRAGDAQVRATLHHRDGAVEALAEALGVPARPGAWIAEDVAAELGVEVGDTVLAAVQMRVGSSVTDPAPQAVPPEDGSEPEPLPPATVEVVGVFPTAEDSVLPAVVDEDAFVTTPRDLPTAGDGRGRSALLLVDRESFDRLVLASGEQPMWVADLRLPTRPTADEVRRAAAAVTELSRQAFREGGRIQLISEGALPQETDAQLATGLREIVDRAEVTTRVAQDQVRSTAWAGVALGVLAVAGGAVLLHAGRRHEYGLATSVGLRPVSVVGLATLEAVPPLLLGTALGAVVSRLGVPLIGPSPDVGPDALAVTLAWSATALAVALVAVGLSAAMTAAAMTRTAAPGFGRRRRGVPWQVLLLTASVVTGVGLADSGAARSPGILAVAFPVLVATTVAGLLLAAVRVRPPWRGTGRDRLGTAGWLATRRVRRSPREATATVVVVAVGTSLAVWSVAADRGVDRGVDDKVAVVAGAETRADIAGPWEAADLPAPLPDAPPEVGDPDTAEILAPPVPELDGSTFVWRAAVTVPPRFGQLDLLVVDAATFAEHALWGASGALQPGRDALALLVDGPVQAEARTGRATSSPELPVVLVGPAWSADPGTVSGADEWSFRYRPVARVAAFPGVTGRALVVDATSFLSTIPGAVHPSVERPPISPPTVLDTELWSTRPVAEVTDFLAAREVSAPVQTRTEAEQTPGLRGASWPLDYLVALGACAALLALVAMVLHGVRAADRDRLGEVMLRRMGMPAARLRQARAREVVWALGLAGLAALLTVGGIAVAGPPLVDPAPRLAPLVRPIVTWGDVVVLVVALAAATVLVTTVARRRSAAVPVGEVLRGED